ncbi:C4-dicarboxylate transport sensor protein DctB [Aquimixticola soesokkakensis]|uniref:C4-dicarboxylate transport sensor protein DctB n=1 Tax=Aquimixticola soesokkakensis TaxID=1519096 RepID=A0A1Y5SR55_9RHOB|nr:ATP-binding protein [Aquimixticola soesokkakensis]SLN46527.1 C4-dicarboxylate transport sensor protein DctB [Aquimixticola soesokkakensis]
MSESEQARTGMGASSTQRPRGSDGGAQAKAPIEGASAKPKSSSAHNPAQNQAQPTALTWVGRASIGVFVLVAVAVVWVTNLFLTERYTILTRNRSEVRQALYSGNLLSELQRNAIVPILLSRDPALIGALNSNDYSQTSQWLISYVDEIGAAGILLLDTSGKVVASTGRERLGETHAADGYFIDALRTNDTIFKVSPRESGGYDFTYSRKIDINNTFAGVIVVEVDLAKFERSWLGISDAVIVTNSEGMIILSTEPQWRGKSEAEALKDAATPTAIERALQVTADWTALPAEAYLGGEAVMRLENRIPFRGWRMASFTTYASVREKVNTVLALEIMGFAILLAGVFYLSSRRALSQAGLFQRESAELRQLNIALQREVAERKKAEKSLQVAEQTLAQSSKLAALGEMSAAVSHELNQPLAAMKTYLAGARLLLQRKRPDEAVAAFQRIDDLIDRMGAITRQLKSYARKGGDSLQPVDLRECVNGALSMMEPQLKSRTVELVRTLPTEPVRVMGDRLRLEQVLVNLLRNALDASRAVENPRVEIMVTVGETATISVRDNGEGIANLDELFEPFYTTKAPGDGVGLGLAISSGIVNELGGRLTARDARTGTGAVFDVSLPLLKRDAEAAE